MWDSSQPVVMAGAKANKQLHLQLDRSRRVRLVREVYLRDEVPCYSELCRRGCVANEGFAPLSSSLRRLVLPDCSVARNYWELLELPCLEGVVLTLTSLHSVQSQGRRAYRRAKAQLQDPRQATVLFDNEFQADCWRQRRRKEPEEAYHTDLNFRAAKWYCQHLDNQVTVVLVTESPEQLPSDENGVTPMSVGEYVAKFHADDEQVTNIFESLRASLESAPDADGSEQRRAATREGDFETHLALESLKAGVKSGQFVQGCLHASKQQLDGSELAVVTLSQGAHSLELKASRGEILIVGQRDRNRAVHGDIVCVQLHPKASWRRRPGEEATEEPCPTGSVVGVVQRNWRDYVCSLDPAERAPSAKRLLAVPWDARVPKIRISTGQAGRLADQRFVVRIDAWDADSQYPSGHFVRALGPVGDLETETQTILIEHSLAVREFSPRQLAELPRVTDASPWRIDPEEAARRRDLRDTHLVFSIDPVGCVDVDDTLSVRQLDNGNLELGVHIADVTHFVKANSLCDVEARQRCTSIYLADRRYDMLPLLLSGNLCSLWSGVDRYAVSVMWELAPDMEVVDVWYGRSVIRSAYKLSYETAQRLQDGAGAPAMLPEIKELAELDDKKLAKRRLKQLRSAVGLLVQAAEAIKQRRMDCGGLELEGIEVQARFSDPDRTQLEDLVPKEPLQMHEVIAECMIFANHWVARKILAYYPNQACLRRHPPPRQEFFDALVRCAEAKGFAVNVESNKTLAESLNNCVDPSDPEVNRILRALATQAMSNARYFSTGSLAREQFAHYGLALDLYTHFTSPIRRYADVLVHRCLLAALGDQEAEAELLPNQELEAQCQMMNDKHRMAQHAQQASTQLFQCLFFRSKQPDDTARVVEAVVCQLRAASVVVFAQRYGIKGSVALSRKDGSVVDSGKVASDLQSALSCPGAEWSAGGSVAKDADCVQVSLADGRQQRYCLFDHVAVRVSVSESHTHGLSLRLELVARLVAKATPGGGKPRTAVGGKEELVKDVQEQQRKRRRREDSEASGSGDEAAAGRAAKLPSVAALHAEGTLYHFLLDCGRRGARQTEQNS